jgi:hypothetical protein
VTCRFGVERAKGIEPSCCPKPVSLLVWSRPWPAAKGIGLVLRVGGMEQDLTEFAEFYESTREDCLRIVLLNVGDLHLAQDLVA